MFVRKLKFGVFIAILTVFSLPPIQSSELAKGVSEFALNFHEECVKLKPGNVFVSPLSVATALALISQAANGTTFEELRNGLHLSGDKATVADQFQIFSEQLTNNIGDSTFAIANKIYVQKGEALKKEFQEIATAKFHAGIEALSFNETKESAEIINKFVEEKTNEKIKNFVKPGLLSSDTEVLVVNAIYFKGAWKYPFDKKRTRPLDFYTSETESVKTHFMSKYDRYNFALLPDLEAKALEMEYLNSKFAFVIVLPNSRTGLRDLETKLNGYDFANITSRFRERNMYIIMPKFKVTYDIELKDVLENMGMNTLFSAHADFTGLVEGADSLKVSKVIHKTFIDVNEEGSEAAGATGVAFMSRMLPPVLQADHPFVYFIRDRETNTIIFSGHIETVDAI